MTGADYIGFAAKIAATYSSPAVSRAYYGAFHVAKTFLSEVGSPAPHNANAHVFVQHRLANCGHEVAMEVGSILRNLHRQRLFADYDLARRQVEDAGNAKSMVATALQVQRSLETCDTDEIRLEIKAGIDEYEHKIAGG